MSWKLDNLTNTKKEQDRDDFPGKTENLPKIWSHFLMKICRLVVVSETNS